MKRRNDEKDIKGYKRIYFWYKPYDDKEVYAAIGDSGNIIYINKEKKVSVGVTGTFNTRIFDRVDFIEQKVLPAIVVGWI